MGPPATDQRGLARTVGRVDIGAVERQPVVLAGVGSVVEGAAGSSVLEVPVFLSAPSSGDVSVQFSTLFVPGLGEPQADPGVDYEPSSGTVTFAPGETVGVASIPVSGDVAVEGDELVVVSFHSPTGGASIGGFWGLGFGTIVDDEVPGLQVLPGRGSIVEGDGGSPVLRVPVSLSSPSAGSVSVQWSTLPVGGLSVAEASPGADYVASSGTVSFAPGETVGVAEIPLVGDLSDEPDEVVVVAFHSPTGGATIGGFWGLGFGTVVDDD